MSGIRKTMQEFAAGTLRSGSKKGPQVRSRSQAIAIGLSEQRAAKKKGPVKEKGARAHSAPKSGDLIRRAMSTPER